MNDALESCNPKVLAMGLTGDTLLEVKGNILITLKSRLATAAPAIVQRMISRRSPRVLRPVSPFKKGSIDAVAIPARAWSVN
jgi:hypothetical protein